MINNKHPLGILFSGVTFLALFVSAIRSDVVSADPGDAFYGVHQPNGKAAVEYAYGPTGMWKNADPIEYRWNYYENYATPKYPFERDRLIGYADGTRFTTSRDANGHILFDFNHDGDLDSKGGFAFHEHNGRGRGGSRRGNPFTQFWFDDNWLARYMSNAYGKPLPEGLSHWDDFVRWRILGGDTYQWSPYNQQGFDQLALDGLYHHFSGNPGEAITNWKALIDRSGAQWDPSNQRYSYRNVHENYHLGLMKILTDYLMDRPDLSSITQNDLIQHSISLRSNILSNQERHDGQPLGWTSSIEGSDSLINIESISVNVLALGTHARHVFEAGHPPLLMAENNYFVRPHNVLSAIKEQNAKSSPGAMTFGPYINFPTGRYQIEFFVRSPNPTGEKVISVDAFDSNAKRILKTVDVYPQQFISDNRWTRISFEVVIDNPNNSMEFRTWWHGTANVDIAMIRVR